MLQIRSQNELSLKMEGMKTGFLVLGTGKEIQKG